MKNKPNAWRAIFACIEADTTEQPQSNASVPKFKVKLKISQKVEAKQLGLKGGKSEHVKR
jgi:hypothetical protein